ncbi:MAG: hypothetical protein ABIH46_07730 [Chloroflexota bacterium]
MAEPAYEVVWPSGRSVYETIPVTDRVPDLVGRTVCELWEWLFRGEEIFPMLRELLSKRYPGIRFVDYAVFGNTHGPKEKEVIAALPGLLRKHGCDVVISGVGA